MNFSSLSITFPCGSDIVNSIESLSVPNLLNNNFVGIWSKSLRLIVSIDFILEGKTGDGVGSTSSTKGLSLSSLLPFLSSELEGGGGGVGLYAIIIS